jgi:DNA-binding transcriptional regulator YdaS (Cro superfamily)
MHQEQVLLTAIRFFGSQSKMANALKLKRSTVNNWLNRDKHIPFEYAIAIEMLTKGVVTRYEIAPYAKWLKNLCEGRE